MAVSAVMLLLPFMIWLIRVCGIAVSFAKRYAVISNGIKNSSSKISPGCMFGICLMFFSLIESN